MIVKTDATHPVDEMLPAGMLFAFGFQHALVMYAGTVAVPLVFAAAMHLSPAQTILLINCGLMTSGIATIIQSIGVWKFGSRLPIVQGSSFAMLASMLLIGQMYGVPSVFGSVIGAGLAMVVLAPFMARLMRFFPPVVIGCLITIIGLTLVPVAGRWIGGGTPGAPDFGSIANLALAFATILITVGVQVWGRGFVANISVLVGLIAGSILAALCGMGHYGVVADAPWFAISMPFAFGMPEFHVMPIVIMLLSMVIIVAETTGNCLAIGRVVDVPITDATIAGALRADGLSTMLGGLFNSFPYNAFTQNTGLIAITDIRSRFVVAAAGVVMIGLGLFPKLGALIAALPPPVLGGCGLVMFGMTTIGGIRELLHVRFEGTRNGLIAAVSIGLGVLPMACPDLFMHISGLARLLLGNGVLLCILSGVLMNLIVGKSASEVESVVDERTP
ncbi:purine permease [Komagataeibacter intermedius]|uniref:Permease n=2 Tax=Komagataeibacter intermedius TaxID=66229 RepID=A0A0N0MGL5_9PROT|nr:nucleobase:cation symporter-2 family protein [Komagataeibacter intermedius]KPH88054.1 permease [Komagataeibacter intermedius AF2]MCF3635787.1 purine permease [Komagataeibacter intermedius]GAN87122.1 transporter of xanthine/uracil [Komagataeibacter intermedius TF2]